MSSTVSSGISSRMSCSSDEMTDDENGFEDECSGNDIDEDESFEKSTSTNSTDPNQDNNSTSCSSEHTHCHSNIPHHSCKDKEACKEKCDNAEDIVNRPRNNLCRCCALGHKKEISAPMSKDYYMARERLRSLLSKKKKLAQQQSQHDHKVRHTPYSIRSLKASPDSAIVGKFNKEIDGAQNSAHDEEKGRSISKDNENEKISELPDSKSSFKSHLKTPGYLIVKEDQIVNLKKIDCTKCTTIEQKPSENSIHNIGDVTNIRQKDSKFEDVDQLLDFIEGNRKDVANEKKRAKKERQKQQKIKDSIKKEGENKQVSEEKKKERKNVNGTVTGFSGSVTDTKSSQVSKSSKDVQGNKNLAKFEDAQDQSVTKTTKVDENTNKAIMSPESLKNSQANKKNCIVSTVVDIQDSQQTLNDLNGVRSNHVEKLKSELQAERTCCHGIDKTSQQQPLKNKDSNISCYVYEKHQEKQNAQESTLNQKHNQESVRYAPGLKTSGKCSMGNTLDGSENATENVEILKEKILSLEKIIAEQNREIDSLKLGTKKMEHQIMHHETENNMLMTMLHEVVETVINQDSKMKSSSISRNDETGNSRQPGRYEKARTACSIESSLMKVETGKTSRSLTSKDDDFLSPSITKDMVEKRQSPEKGTKRETSSLEQKGNSAENKNIKTEYMGLPRHGRSSDHNDQQLNKCLNDDPIKPEVFPIIDNWTETAKCKGIKRYINPETCVDKCVCRNFDCDDCIDGFCCNAKTVTRTRCTNREICFTECATGADIDECKTHEYCWNPIPPSLECVDCPDTTSCIDDQTSNFPVLSTEDCVTCAALDVLEDVCTGGKGCNDYETECNDATCNYSTTPKYDNDNPLATGILKGFCNLISPTLYDSII